jgi:hypothetical protein
MVSAVKLSELRYWLRQPGMVVFLLAVITEMLPSCRVRTWSGRSRCRCGEATAARSWGS